MVERNQMLFLRECALVCFTNCIIILPNDQPFITIIRNLLVEEIGLCPLITLDTRTPERLHASYSAQRFAILARMPPIKHVTFRQEGFVSRFVRLTDNIVHCIGTTISKDAVARMRVSRMPLTIRLHWYMRF